MAAPIAPSSSGQSQIRDRISAIERFRADNPAPALSGKDSDSLFCRICRDSYTEGEGLVSDADSDLHGELVSPCRCRGSVARVHVDCLERWLAESDSTSCELCGHEYSTIRTQSYGVLASIPAWLIRQGGPELIFDLAACIIFTPIAVFGTHLGLSADYDNVSYFEVTLMAAIDLMYSAWLTMRLHYHAARWYSWWRRNATVKVILDSDETKDQQPDS